ncbi:cytochrome P450 [Mycena galopus ATCC 62051]|nr:cytochrome P450 [Mycena galopus ATCC 62051]
MNTEQKPEANLHPNITAGSNSIYIRPKIISKHSMAPLLSPVVLFSAVIALVTHYIFNRNEPNALHFVLGVLSCAQISALVQWVRGCSVLEAAYKSTTFLGVYLLVLALSISFYRLSPWHPLAKYPGPRLSHLTKWWMVNQVVFRGGQHTKLQQFVSTLLAGPNEISVNLPTAIRPIYSKLDRAQFYQGAPFSADALISVLDRETHKKRRQPWENALNSESLASYLPTICTRITQAVQILKDKSSEGRTTHLDYWIYLFFLDTMGDIGFSGGFESMKAEKDTEGWLYTLAMGVFFASSMGQIPWLKDIVNVLPRRGPIDTFHQSIEKKIHQLRDSDSAKAKRLDILGFLVIADSALIVVSATDTSVQAVVTIFRYLGLDPERQSRLRAEVDGVLSDVVDDEESIALAIAGLPFLMRVYKSPFGPLRTTGGSGAYVCGEYIPPNTTIHVPFIPERWLNDDPLRKMLDSDLPLIDRTSFMPFGAGFGSCIGRNLAIQNVK